MPRLPRQFEAGDFVHVLNRGHEKRPLFLDRGEYQAFQALLVRAVQRAGTRLIAFCLMPNHWHLVLHATAHDDIPKCIKWLSQVHVKRFRVLEGSTGLGTLYQGRYRSFVIENDDYLYNVIRYVERNALTAGLVSKAQDWAWGSLRHRYVNSPLAQAVLGQLPWGYRSNWLAEVNAEQPNSAQLGSDPNSW